MVWPAFGWCRHDYGEGSADVLLHVKPMAELIACEGTADLAFNPRMPSQFALTCNDPIIRTYDLRMTEKSKATASSVRTNTVRMTTTVLQQAELFHAANHIQENDPATGVTLSMVNESIRNMRTAYEEDMQDEAPMGEPALDATTTGAHNEQLVSWVDYSGTVGESNGSKMLLQVRS